MTGPAERAQLLRESAIEIEGVLREASNLTLKVRLQPTGAAVYKPVRGERPLHDFPSGTLAGREVAAYLVSAAGGWDLVPSTVLRDGPLGVGSAQWWIDQPPNVLATPGAGLLEVVTPEDLQPGWLPVLQAESPDGEPLLVVHADDPALASLAVLDVVLNNADRKGSHLLIDADGRLWGVDHGVCLHVHDKLRTVLWGWAGAAIPERDLGSLTALGKAMARESWRGELLTLIQEDEVTALQHRVATLLRTGVFPAPPVDRYPLPWPIW